MTNDADAVLDDMQEIIDDFLIEADELITSLDSDLVKLETTPGDLELLNTIFRAAHTIKGTSSFLGLDHVTELTHKMEDILNRLRKGEMAVTPDIMDVLLESLDLLKALVQAVHDGTSNKIPIDKMVQRLVDAFNSQNNGKPDQLQAKTSSAGNTVTSSGAAAKNATAESSQEASKEHRSAEQTIRVDVARLDTLMNLMGELVLGRNSLMQTINRLRSESGSVPEQLTQAVAGINYITTELQLSVMKMRMQQVAKVFNKMPRLVRDLARESGKIIQLKISGEATELDKSVIEEIGDPLVHIIRNSCDHGLEMPEEREAAGKSPTGTIEISATQEGSNIVIKITDDGRGLDLDAIRAKAIERGLVTEEEAERLEDKEIFKFIFGAGFSTAKKVTGVSGRGVGMDVVRTNIEKLSGMIEISSKRGEGTCMAIKLPLTLAIIQGLLVQSDNEVFILPLSSVHETVKSRHSEVHYVNKHPVLRLRDDIIPILNLNEIFSQQKSGIVMTEKPYIVVVGLAEKKLGIVIDRFLGQEEVVIKSLGTFLGSSEGVAGATILGDGRIRLIVDMIGLFSLAKKLN